MLEYVHQYMAYYIINNLSVGIREAHGCCVIHKTEFTLSFFLSLSLSLSLSNYHQNSLSLSLKLSPEFTLSLSLSQSVMQPRKVKPPKPSFNSIQTQADTSVLIVSHFSSLALHSVSYSLCLSFSSLTPTNSLCSGHQHTSRILSINSLCGVSNKVRFRIGSSGMNYLFNLSLYLPPIFTDSLSFL